MTRRTRVRMTRAGVFATLAGAWMLGAGARPAGAQVQPDPTTAPQEPPPSTEPMAPTEPTPMEPAPPPPAAPMTATPLTEVSEPVGWRPPSRVGNALMVGGAFGDFVGDTARRATNMSGGWGLRLVGGTRLPVGAEVAYVGGVAPLDRTTTSDDYLLSTAVEGALRLGVPIVTGSTLVGPFAFGGAGWSRYNLVNEGADRGLLTQSQDDQFTIPMGVGVLAAHRGFIAEARGTYRQAFDEELFGSSDMSTWSVSLTVGGEF